jgi:hypothetical protein
MSINPKRFNTITPEVAAALSQAGHVLQPIFTKTELQAPQVEPDDDMLLSHELSVRNGAAPLLSAVSGLRGWQTSSSSLSGMTSSSVWLSGGPIVSNGHVMSSTDFVSIDDEDAPDDSRFDDMFTSDEWKEDECVSSVAVIETGPTVGKSDVRSMPSTKPIPMPLSSMAVAVEQTGSLARLLKALDSKLKFMRRIGSVTVAALALSETKK